MEHNGTIQNDDNGMIWIQNAENGAYKLNVTGTGNGEYTADIWLIGASNDKWFQFKKTISNGSQNVFTISFNTETGGTAVEYIAPSPTPTPTVVPTKVPSPTAKPTPTKTPTPTAKPTPSPQPPAPKPIINTIIKAILFILNFLIKDMKKK